MIFKRFALVLLSFLAACVPLAQAAPTAAPSSSPGGTVTPTAAGIAAEYPDLGPAPELENTVWLNTPVPLHLADLRGKVVLLEMWTFDCINCQHVIPSLKAWDQKYANQGLLIIGNHFPEFDFERNLDNLKEAVKQDGIHYAVAQDNDGKTWDAYHNAYWPTIYLIDKRGHLRYTHIGEGAYPETEAAIQALLAEPGI
jgi:thiol-disulfide isomerase/thioredoxin